MPSQKNIKNLFRTRIEIRRMKNSQRTTHGIKQLGIRGY